MKNKSIANDSLINWVARNKITTILTLGIILDWLPGFLFGEDSSLTGTKLIVLPLITIDILINIRSYFKSIYGWIYAIGLIVGVGGGWLLGNITLARLINILPTILVFLYFLKPKTANETKNILKLIFYGSLLVPAFVILSWLEIITPLVHIEKSVVIRVLPAVSWSTLGLYTVIIPSTLGGMLLFNSRFRNSQIIISIGIIFMGLVGVLLPAQRSSAISFAIAFILALLVYSFPLTKKKLAFLAIFVIIFALVVSMLSSFLIDNVGSSLLMRMQYEEDVPRNTLIDKFIRDITTDINLFGIGNDSIFLKTGITTMHFIFGEAYYDGGLIFLSVILFIFSATGLRLFRLIFAYHRANRNFLVNSILIILFIGFLVQLLSHPGLNARLVYVILGLCLSTGNKIEAGKVLQLPKYRRPASK